MEAQVYQVLSRDKTTLFDIPGPSDFSITEEETISIQRILDDPSISLYCLDPEKEQAIFVKTPPDVNLNQAPFYYVAQYEQAIQLIKVSYNILHQLADQVEVDDRRLILIYSTGRSGTTVASAAFDQAEDVVSFSEPDVFTQLVQIRDFSGANDALVGKLTASCIRLTCKKTVQDQVAFLAVKFRSFVIELADLICQDFPGAKCLFLYRNAEPWLNSVLRAFGGYLSTEQIRGTWFLGKQVIRMVETYPISDPREITAGLTMGLMWLDHMERCLEMIYAGHPILPVRYEDLKANPLPVMGKIFEYCGVIPANERVLAEVFATDSQAGTPIARDQISQKVRDFGAETLEILRQLIAEHPVIHSTDYQLPGTLTID